MTLVGRDRILVEHELGHRAQIHTIRHMVHTNETCPDSHLTQPGEQQAFTLPEQGLQGRGPLMDVVALPVDAGRGTRVEVSLPLAEG